jgi:hypothetical protein
MFTHGTATEILATAGIAGVRQQDIIPPLVEAARSMLKSIHVIVLNKIRFNRQTTPDELQDILKLP